ncbi:hypothetical protein K474DRAFT_1692483 [Panus rudis PR-1116 ss-1]|nr:hypothetical protein K474DRAFT_1692483 [Panus rudis PR-1116 ss-1]
MRILGVSLFARVKQTAKQSPVLELVFFQTHLGYYVASMLLGNILSSVGYVINITWVLQGGIREDTLCSTQGALTQIGDLTSSYFTAAIAVHTFCTIALRTRLPQWFCPLALILGWVLILAAGIVPAVLNLPRGHAYGTDGSVCGISLQYPLIQTLLHLTPIFLACLVSAVFYSLIFLILRGTLMIKGGLKFTFDPRERWNARSGRQEYHKFIGAVAKALLWFPIAYITLMLPHIILCLVETSGFPAPFAVRVFAVTCSSLLGVVNVALFYNTLRVMAPVLGESNAQPDVEKSFSSPEDNSPLPAKVPAPIPRAFPPPRRTGSVASTYHSRGPSSESVGTESTRKLLPLHLAHARNESSSTAPTIGRPITPIAEVDNMTPQRPDSRTSNTSNESGLPAPRRQNRSPVIRRPTMTIEVSSPDDSLAPVNLNTPAQGGSRTARLARNSFIKMYGPNSAARFEEKAQRLTFGEGERNSSIAGPSFSPVSSSSSTYPMSSTADISDGDVPLSAFMGEFTKRSNQPLRTPTHKKAASEDVTEGGSSSKVIAALRKNEMTLSPNAHSVKASRRRSKSMDDLAKQNSIPTSLRPGMRPLVLGKEREMSMYSIASYYPSMTPTGTSPALPTSIIDGGFNRYPGMPQSVRSPSAVIQDGPSRKPTVLQTPSKLPQSRGFF